MCTKHKREEEVWAAQYLSHQKFITFIYFILLCHVISFLYKHENVISKIWRLSRWHFKCKPCFNNNHFPLHEELAEWCSPQKDFIYSSACFWSGEQQVSWCLWKHWIRKICFPQSFRVEIGHFVQINKHLHQHANKTKVKHWPFESGRGAISQSNHLIRVTFNVSTKHCFLWQTLDQTFQREMCFFF